MGDFKCSGWKGCMSKMERDCGVWVVGVNGRVGKWGRIERGGG